MKQFNLDTFSQWEAKSLGDDLYLFPQGGYSSVYADFERGTFCGETITPDMYLSMDITVLGDRAAGVCWEFWESNRDGTPLNGGADMRIKMGLLPNLKTRIVLPFSALAANTVFMPRTPGKLKTVVGGHPVHLDRITKFAFAIDKTPHDLTLKIENVCILNEEPDYPLEDKIMVDALGQKSAPTGRANPTLSKK